MLVDKITRKDILHVTRKECKVIESVQLCIHTGINNCVFHILNANNLLRLGGNKIGNSTGTCIKVIHHLITCKGSKLTRHLIEVISLLAVCLIERLGTDLEAKPLHLFIDNISPFISDNLKVAECVVALVVDHIEKRSDFRESIRDVL